VARIEAETETPLAQPRLLVAYDQPAELRIGGGEGAPEISMRVRVAKGG